MTPLEQFFLGFWVIFWAGILLTLILSPREVRAPILARCFELVREPFTRAFWHRHKWELGCVRPATEREGGDGLVLYRGCIRCGALERHELLMLDLKPGDIVRINAFWTLAKRLKSEEPPR